MDTTHRSPAASPDSSRSSIDASAPSLPEATVKLLARARQGDAEALDSLLQRTIPPLKRWARGRLPVAARSMDDTGDLVQDSVFSALRHLDAFEARDRGALQAYLRQAVMNRIRDLVRKFRRRPLPVEIPDQILDMRKSPLDEAIGRDHVDQYHRAVRALSPADRTAVIGRVERQLSYDELAVVLKKPSPAAARMAVTRAMQRLAVELGRTTGAP